MSAVSFRSVFMVASCAGAALGCYLVSLRVASERAALEDVETQIVLAQRDIRVLQTEIGTRGRLAQLERWNVKVMALSAPTADQFLKGGFELARFTAPERKAPIEAPVVFASAPAPESSPPAQPSPPSNRNGLMHEASLKPTPSGSAHVSLAPRTAPSSASDQAKPAAKPEITPKASAKASAKPVPTKAPSAKATPAPRKAATAVDPKGKGAEPGKAKPAKSASRDPLAPAPDSRRKVATAAKASGKATRDSAKTQ